MAPPRSAITPLPPQYGAASSDLPAAALDRWWLLFDDAQLAGLVDKALAQGYSIREGLARLEEARAIRSTALNAFDPQGNLQLGGELRHTKQLESTGSDLVIPGIPGGGGAAALTGAGTTKSANASLPISWEIDLFGRRAATRRAADADLAAARFDYEATRAALAADVATSLFQARGLAAQQADAEATLRIQEQLLSVLQRQAARGLAATSEADRVATDVAQAQAQYDDTVGALKASRRALLVLLGSGADDLDTLQITAAISAPPPIPATLPGDLLQRRPDVRQTEAQVAAASGNFQVARLALFPTLTLQPGAGATLQRGPFDTTTAFWSLGAGLVAPVLDRPRLLGELRVSSARAEQAVLAYERTVQTAFSESDQALTRLAADRRRLIALEAGLQRAERAFSAARIRYDRGFSDLQELLDAERSLRSARTALTNARVEALTRSVDAFKALGGGWTPAAQGNQAR